MNSKTIFLLVVSFCIYYGDCTPLKQSIPEFDGSISITRRGNVVFHTYTSNEMEPGFQVDSHIIELPTKLIIFDTQALLKNAQDVLEYARRLLKPIDRVIISHAHFDHYAGAAVFKNIAKICSSKEVIEEIKNTGEKTLIEFKAAYGVDAVADEVIIPDTEIDNGDETIDGVLFEFRKLSNTESNHSVVIGLPTQKAALVGDLVYNRVHLYLGANHIDEWIQTLKTLDSVVPELYDFILLGHAKPASGKVLQENIQYLESARKVLKEAKSIDKFKAEMIRLYPDYDSEFVLDLSKETFYPSEKDDEDSSEDSDEEKN